MVDRVPKCSTGLLPPDALKALMTRVEDCTLAARRTDVVVVGGKEAKRRGGARRLKDSSTTERLAVLVSVPL